MNGENIKCIISWLYLKLYAINQNVSYQIAAAYCNTSWTESDDSSLQLTWGMKIDQRHAPCLFLLCWINIKTYCAVAVSLLPEIDETNSSKASYWTKVIENRCLTLLIQWLLTCNVVFIFAVYTRD